MRLLPAFASIAVLGGLVFFISPVRARIVFQDDFEAYTVDDAVHNLIPPIGEGYYWLGANHYGYIADSGTNPPGGASGGTKFVRGLTALDGYGQQNMVITAANETAATDQVVKFNLDAYVVGSVAQNYGLDLSTLTSGGVYENRAWDINLQTNGTLSIYDDSGYNNVPGGTYRTNMWVPVEVVADYAARTFQATVDGFTFGGNFSTAPANNTLRRFSVSEAGYGGVFVDNVSIEIIGLGELGDYNGDDAVNAADYVVWRKTDGTDFDLLNEVATPGTVTPEDFDEWRSRFGNPPLGSANSGFELGSVPEPNSALLVLLAGAAIVTSRRRPSV